MQLTDSTDSDICFFMDNVYQPPQANLQPDREPTSGFGRFEFGQAFSLAGSVYGSQLGLAIGSMVLYFLLSIALYFTIIGYFLALPHLYAAFYIMAYRMIRKEATISDLFAGFRSYGRVLLAAIILGLISMAIYLPFSWPYLNYMYGDYPFSSFGDPEQAEQIGEWAKTMTARSSAGTGELFSYIGLMYLSFPFFIFLYARLLLVFPLIVLRGHTAIEAFKLSWKNTGPDQWWLMLFLFVGGVIAMAGALLCGVGAIFSIPYSMMLTGAAIYQLLGEGSNSEIV